MSGIDLEDLKVRLNAVISALENRFFSDDSCRRILREHFHVEHLEALGLADYETGAIAAGAVLQYLYETQKKYTGTPDAPDCLYDRTVYDAGYVHAPEPGAY